MAQYSYTSTSTAGFKVTVVLDTESNLQTITVTGINGKTATATQSANITQPDRSTVSGLNDALILAGNFNSNITDITTALRAASTNVVLQEQQANTAATAAGTSPPESPSPPVPTSATPISDIERQALIEANTTELQGAPPTQPRTAEEEAFLAANTDPTPSNPSNIVDTGVTRDQAALLEANTSDDAPAQITSDQQAFLDANTSELQGDNIPQGQATFLEVNNSELQSENNITREQAALLEANADPQNDDTAENNAEIQRLQNRGTSALKSRAESQPTRQDIDNAKANGDWRVRISLASKANYFYRAAGQEGILKPLAATDGVIFPYTPTISISYNAQYDQQSVTHSNYKTTQYTASSVDAISIGCDFTAQDTYEANYLLAVIHFFRSLTKMFYGQDENPSRGTPPPLCYLHGYGDFQFNKHPMAITGFTYSLPNDVDYIRTNTTSFSAGEPLYNRRSTIPDPAEARGAPRDKTKDSTPVNFGTSQVQPTYVPTRISLSISAIPVVARYDVSNKFSLKDYASGRLLMGNKEKWGGFW